MRTFEPLTPRGDMHPADADLWKRLNNYLQQTSKAWGSISRNISTDQSAQPPVSPPGVNDHGLLAGLVPILNSDGSVADYNDDHTQYPLIFGRPGGQYLYGSRPGTGISWVADGPVMAANSSVDGTSVAHTVDYTVPVSNGIVLVASSGFNPETGVGETNYHTSVTDTGGNTWTKLKEYTVRTSVGGSAKIVSLWFTLVTSGLTTASTITINYSTTMDRHAAEAYQFTMSPGLSVTLVSYTTNGVVSAAPAQPSLSLSGLTGESLFVRAMVSQPGSGAGTVGSTYNATAAFTPFVTDHTDSTDYGPSGLDFGFSARGEFQVLTAAGATSAPILESSDTYTTAAIFGALQIVSSSSGVVTPSPVTGWAAITGGFITTIRSTSESTWASIPIQTSAPAGRLVFLVMATHSLNPGFGAGVTSYHSTLTDTQSNTWTKLKEFTTSYFAGVEEQTISLWYSQISVALAAGVDTMQATYSHTFVKKSIESYQFTLSGGATVSLSASTTGDSAPDTDPVSLALSGVASPAIYIRGVAIHAGVTDSPTTFTPTVGYTAFTTDHTNSTNVSGEGTDRNVAARGEFLVSTASSSTSDPSTGSSFPDCASVFCAITLTSTSPPPNAYLRLGAANLADASTIELTGRDLRFNAGIGGGDFIFDPLGEGGFVGILDFDSISGSDKTFVFPNTSGTVALTSDLSAYLKLDASNDPITGTLDTQLIEPSSTATYDIGASSKKYRDAYLSRDLYLGGDVILNADEVTDVGAVGLGAVKFHFGFPSASPGGTLRSNSRGLCWLNPGSGAYGDIFVGADNYTGASGNYVQRVTKANSSISTVNDYREDSTNLIQGFWGTGSTAGSPFLHLNYNCGQATVGGYNFNSSEDGTTYFRDGLVSVGEYIVLSGANLGGGGLWIAQRGGTTNVSGMGLYLCGDEANSAFVLRTMSGSAASTKAGQRVTGIWFAGTRLTNVSPSVTDVIDLGVATTHRYKNIYYHGTLTSTIAGSAISLAAGGNIVLSTTTGTKIGTGTTQLLGFYNATPVAQPTAYTQTYSTATRTHSNPTGTSVATTASTNVAPFGYTTAAQADAIVTALNAAIVDIANVKQVLNQVIDDFQANGLLA